MKKKMLMRGLLGAPLGITIGFLIALAVSAFVGDGRFYPVTPALISTAGSELNAVALQTLLCAVMGAGFGAASLIWELDTWSLAKQSGVYFLTACLLMLPIAYFANWMPHTLRGVAGYVAIFVAIFAAVWLSQYLFWRYKVQKMNARIQKGELP